jgi:DNA-binding NtrC family response regulator
MTTWIRYATDESTSASRVRAALADLALDPQPTIPAPSDVGLVVFDQLDVEVLQLIRTSSRGGLIRILAIDASPEAVDELGPWPLLEAGASDVLVVTDPRLLADQVSARLSRWKEIDDLVRSPLVQRALPGRTPVWTSLLREIVEIARFGDESVLLVGESGTGKDVVARLIHELDPRPFKGQFATLDRHTLDQASGRGDRVDRDQGTFEGGEITFPVPAGLGAYRVPSGGTLYVDEAGALPPTSQELLLRAIEDGIDNPEGDWPNPKVRLICSTSDDGSDADPSGAADPFSQRITARLRLPPLRERRDDIPAIAEQLLGRLRPDLKNAHLDPELAVFLTNRDYPANVHDLLTLMRGISVRHVGPGVVTVGAIPPQERRRIDALDLTWHGDDLERAIGRAVDAGASLKTMSETVRDTAVRIALERERGDVRSAAKRLRATTRTVESRIVPPPRVDTDEQTEAASTSPSVVEVPDSALLGAREDQGVSEAARDAS